MKKKFVEIISMIALVLVTLSQVGCAYVSNGCSNKSRVHFNSIPEGADVKVDDEYIGKTPCFSKLSPAEKKVEFSRTGYQTITKKSISAADTAGKACLVVDAAGIICPPVLVVNYVVDLSSGAYKSHPKELAVSLVEVEAKPAVCQSTGASAPTASASASVNLTVQSAQVQQVVDDQTPSTIQSGGKCPKCGHNYIPNYSPPHCPFCCPACHKKYFKLDATGKEIECHKRGLVSGHGNVDDK